MARSDSEAESVASQESAASFSQKFEPREDDEDLLWEVERITAEKGKLFKVKWKGFDPATGKPWADSWVEKKDCTPDLVIAWKAEKKEKELRKKATKGRDSAASRKGVVLSKASTSKLPQASKSTSANSRRGRSSTAATTRAATTVSPSTARRQSKSAAVGLFLESEDETRPHSQAKAQGKKRKIAEADSAHNSAHVPVDVNVNEAGDAVEPRTAGRPSKKRKIEIETVKQEPTEFEDFEGRDSPSRSRTHTQAQAQATQNEERREVRKPRGKSLVYHKEEEEEDEEEEEERMVEDALSQGYNSPTPVEEEEEEIPKPTINKGKGRAMDVDSDVDDSSSVIVVVSRPPKKSTTTNGTNTMKSSTKTAKPIEPSTTKPRAKTTKKTKDEVVAESKPPSPPPKFGPPKRKSSTHPNAKTSKPPRTPPPRAAPAPAPAPAPPTPSATVTPKARINSSRKILRMTTTNEPRRSYARPAKHEKDPDTDSDAEPPHLVWTGYQSQNNIVPIEEPSAVWQGDSEVSVLLSPRDLERLRVFDEEVMNVPIPSMNSKLGARGQTIERTASSSKTVMAGTMEEDKGQSTKSGQSGRKTEVEIIDLVSPERSPPPSQKAAPKQPPPTSADVGAEAEEKEDEKLNGNTAMVVDVDPDVEEEEEEAQPAVPVPSKEPQPQQPNKRDLKSTTPKPKSIPSSSTTGAESKTNGNFYRHRSANDHREEIIPETEEEESQSQSQSRSLNLDLPTQAPAPSYPQPPSTPGGRSTVRSRMKPRTPLSRASSIASHHQAGAGDRDRDRDRPLRPIPEMLPSVFHPHLLEPISSLPESIHDASGSSDNRKNAGGVGDGDQEVAMSSIEDFDSPDKSQRSKQPAKTFVVVNNTGKGKERQKQKESAEDIWESEVVKRGQEIAEAAKRKSEAERNEVPPNQRQKKTLDEIRATTRSSRSRSASNVSHVSLGPDENRKGKGKEKDKGKGKEKALDLIVEKVVEEQDEEMQDLSTSVVPPASGPRATQPEPEPEQPEPEPGHESLTLQEMEAAYVDLNGGAGMDDRIPDPFHDIIALRQEEEESTQDMMVDVIPQRRVDDIDVQAGWDARPPPPEPTPATTVVTHPPLDPIPEDENNAGGAIENEKSKVPVIPEIVIQDPGQSEPSKLQTSEEDPNVVGQMRTTRSRSRSQTPFVTTQTTNGKEKLKTSSKKTSKAGSRQTSLAPPDRPGQSHNDVLDRLNVALALNDTRLNDITRLESELASEKLKLSEIQVKADDDHQAMQEAINQINAEFATEKESLELMVKDSEAKYTELLVEKTEWEAERARLMAELESARQGKVSAEKDRDFFRENYSKASGFVSSVRDENKDLEKRIKIAEDQVQIGVAGVKKTFELRIKALEDDAKSWKTMANFLIEKDRRSDNDHLRRRAGEQPELLARCAHLSANVEALEDRIEELETELEQKTGEWMASREEVQRWKNELTQVHIALTEATTKLERLGRAGGGGHGADPDSNEFVYCCQWRVGYADGGESRACQEVFPTMSGFEEHITNEHLGA